MLFPNSWFGWSIGIVKLVRQTFLAKFFTMVRYLLNTNGWFFWSVHCPHPTMNLHEDQKKKKNPEFAHFVHVCRSHNLVKCPYYLFLIWKWNCICPCNFQLEKYSAKKGGTFLIEGTRNMKLKNCTFPTPTFVVNLKNDGRTCDWKYMPLLTYFYLAGLQKRAISTTFQYMQLFY